MSEPEFDRDDPDAESMFDFLADEEALEPHRRKSVEASAERPLPIIRKPVPVSESGPLLPPKPGAPVEPPPELTTSSDRRELNLDFPSRRPREPQTGSGASRVDSDDSSNVTRLDPRVQEGNSTARPGQPDLRSAPAREAATNRDDSLADEFDSLGLDDDLNLDDDWHAGLGVTYPAEPEVENRSGRGRRIAMIVALLLIAAGISSLVVSNKPPEWLKLPGSDRTLVGPEAADQTVDSSVAEAESDDDVPDVAFTPSPLMLRFRDELARVEQLVGSGALDDAEAALSSMDRTVYGYGAAEFSALETRIVQIRSGVISPEDASDSTVVADAQAAADEAERLAEEQVARDSAVRQAEERAAQEEAARLAEEQAARAAAVRQAEERAAQEEAARLAEEQAARAAAVRQAEQRAAQEESGRLAEAQAAREAAVRQAEQRAAQEESARLADAQAAREAAVRQAEQRAAQEEAARLAEEQAARVEAERIEQLGNRAGISASAAEATVQAVDADRLATDRRIAEERAALQRQQAREQRLIEAREREAQAEQARAAALRASEQSSARNSQSDVSTTDAALGERRALAEQVISDNDLQLVYRRFVNLQKAISERDINAVVSLTERSGVRVQQLMQMFENSTEIDARIRNVSTSNATGEIKGTLQINRIKRANGNYVKPPESLSSIALSSKRDENGWSAISW